MDNHDLPPRPGRPSRRTVLNVGGVRFVTLTSTLHRLPGTRLSDLDPSDPAYDPDSDEFFFDRNPRLFPYILDTFREGEMHFPQCICAPVVRSELTFWGLAESRVAACCWKACCEWEEQTHTLGIISRAFSGPTGLEENSTGDRDQCWAARYRRARTRVWLFLEDPRSSKWAKVWANVYLAILVISTVSSCLETHPDFRVPATYRQNVSMSPTWNTSNPKIRMYQVTEELPVLRITHLLASCLFFFELILRFTVCPNKRKFFTLFFNILDILAVFPMFIFSALRVITPSFWMYYDAEIIYYVFGLTTILRSVRLLKIVKHNRGLLVLCLALKASSRMIMLLILVVAIGMLIFSTMIYLVELYNPHSFPSILNGFWWSVITMTTVGYGDVIPVTSYGYLVGSMCAVCGMLITGLPIPVIASNFHLFYTCAKFKKKLEQLKIEQSSSTDVRNVLPSPDMAKCKQHQPNENH